MSADAELDAELDALRALEAIWLEVSGVVAADVSNKVRAALHAKDAEIARLQEAVTNQERPVQEMGVTMRDRAEELTVCKDMLRESFAMAFAMGAPPHCTLEEAMVHVVAAPRKEIERLQAELAALREAVGALPEVDHSAGCACKTWHEDAMCTCDAKAANAARAEARKVAGLGERWEVITTTKLQNRSH